MRAFSDEEFNCMVEELLCREPAAFDCLCSIACKTLSSSVRRWCRTDSALAGGDYEQDIMQEIYLRLIKTTVSSFLLRDGIDAPPNANPDGFSSWMFAVAKNIARDYSRRVRRSRFHTEDDDTALVTLADPQDAECERAGHVSEQLARAFSIVLNSDVQVYKVLTWLAQSLFLLRLDVTRIQSNEKILSEFSDRTLFGMRDIVVSMAETLPWLRLTAAQRDRIDAALYAPHHSGRLVGELTYKEFFMSKGAKATVSDWVNRMDSLIKRESNNGTFNG